ncbi:D-sedoheptulose 7-phosphate isomerase [Helicobacter sp. 13S00477-4]|uniref:D-sedoheptulose 7-phosphate isomerase n=1 Tax=Helicobacter sp. 13S00477-4 TaxID=1905759 RepID=UPI000BA793F4|nr:D-sedoheptulose 7-phosphate isomerase [Helicobacter sp. 13S00477-4]PAF52644.1 phosphoheptose isomerase [Helicobacter sp. 13S00477-4]
MKNFIQKEFLQHSEIIQKSLLSLNEKIQQTAAILNKCLSNGGKIIICGNGGSAADAQHFAAELSGRYKKERKALGGIAITTDTSALTAIGNDYGYDYVFSRQVEAIANSRDLIFGISTSGNSKNIIKAFESGKKIGCQNIGLSGKNGGKMSEICDINLIVPSEDTPRIQETHILIIHILCDIIENTNIEDLH